MILTADFTPPPEAPPAVTHSIPRATVTRCTLSSGEGHDYFVYVPEQALEGAPVLVTVHGISRNARAHAKAFSRLADRYGVVVVAPLFNEPRFPGYQRLGISRRQDGPRPDRVLDAILSEVGAATGARTDRFYLSGFSGGGQFAHRYAMAHPERGIAVAIGAPGWYTFPDASTRYPRGTMMPNRDGLPQLNAVDFLRVPMAVFVGEHDDQRDPALRRTRRVDAQQGLTRMKRARRWVDAMRSAAAKHGYGTRYEFHVLSGCGHSFRQCMRRGDLGWRIFEFLFAAPARRTGVSANTAMPDHRSFLVFNAA